MKTSRSSISELVVVRVVDLTKGEIKSPTPLGVLQARYIARMIERYVRREAGSWDASGVSVISSNQHCMELTVSYILGELGIPFSDELFTLYTRWPRVEDAPPVPTHLSFIHEGVIESGRNTTIVVLPEKLAQHYPIYFMQKESVGEPNTRILDSQKPGEAVWVTSRLGGGRNTLTLPAGHVMEEFLKRVAGKD
jgi:hypothetical protein